MTTQTSLFQMPAADEALASGGAHVHFHTPEQLTKELQLQRTPAGRKLRLSSNLLQAFGFTAGARLDRRVVGPFGGLEFRVDPTGASKVYERHYARRTNNPAETQLDVNCQSDLDAAFAGYVQRVHFTIQPGRIVAEPVIERAPAIRFGLRQSASPLTAFVAMTAGIDAHSARRVGFNVTDLLEWRPNEKRDAGAARDLTETGVCTAVQNVAVRRVWNEDIRTIDLRRVERALVGQPQVGMLHISVQCDDFSAAKGKKFRDQHMDDLDTTFDLTYDALNLISVVRPATVVIENVPRYLTSASGALMTTKLRRWGYQVHAEVCSAPTFGGRTTRDRAYIVATVFDGFQFPTPPGFATTPLWDAVVADQLSACRDITHTESVRKGLLPRDPAKSDAPWIRLITPDTRCAGTVMKSQNRQCKDMVAIRDREGRIRFPNETVLRRLNGIPDDFSFDAVAGEVAAEQIGQSIDYGMHEAILRAVRDHLMTAWGTGRAT